MRLPQALEVEVQFAHRSLRGDPLRSDGSRREGKIVGMAALAECDLEVAEHLNRAFTDAFDLGAETATREIVENSLSVGFDSLDAKLARIGYTPKALAERFDAHPAEIRRFVNGRLDPERTAELGAVSGARLRSGDAGSAQDGPQRPVTSLEARLVAPAVYGELEGVGKAPRERCGPPVVSTAPQRLDPDFVCLEVDVGSADGEGLGYRAVGGLALD